MAVDKAEKMEPLKDLFSSIFIGLLWKEAIRCSTDAPFLTIASKLEPDLLIPSIQYLAQYLDDNDEKNKKLTSIVGKRIEWLKIKIEKLDNPFSWEMLEANFSPKPLWSRWTGFCRERSGLPQAEKVLEAAKPPWWFKKLRTLKLSKEAHNFVATWRREDQVNCSFEMKVVAADGSVAVTITKTRDAFLKS